MAATERQDASRCGQTARARNLARNTVCVDCSCVGFRYLVCMPVRDPAVIGVQDD